MKFNQATLLQIYIKKFYCFSIFNLKKIEIDKIKIEFFEFKFGGTALKRNQFFLPKFTFKEFKRILKLTTTNNLMVAEKYLSSL